jgi:nicotinamidase/pyrazinamidase
MTMASSIQRIRAGNGDALIVTDVQNDFLLGGSLCVQHGNEVIAVLNRYMAVFSEQHLPVYATRDWHPPNHCSFHNQGGPWPPHCVAETRGAEFPATLNLPAGTVIISKASQPDKDAYSGFEGTALDASLRAQNVKRVFVGGLTTDYCVLNTVCDAIILGYEAFLLTDAIRAVNVDPDDGRLAEAQMQRLGATAISLDDLDT